MQKTFHTLRFAKNSALIVFLSLFLLSLVGNQTNAAGTVLSTRLPTGTNRYTAAVGTVFSVHIEISDIFNLYGYEFRLFYNNTVLNALNMTPYVGTSNMSGFFFPQYMLWRYEINNDPYGNGTGYVWFCATLPFSYTEGQDGSGRLATVEFNATEFGTTILTFDMHILGDPQSQPIAHTVSTGIITVGEVSRIPEADAGGPYVGAVNVPLTLNASGSFDPQGLPLVSFYWDFGDGTNGTFIREFVDHTYTAVDNYTATLTVTDAENLTSTDLADVRIVVDTTPPTGSLTITGKSPDPSHFTNSTSVILRFSFFDAESGVDQMRVSNDNASLISTEWISKANSKSWNLTTGDGVKTVFVQYKDRTGNPSLVYTRSIILDTTPPTVTIISPSDGSEVRSSTVLVNWTRSDAGSDIDHSEVSLDGASWDNVGANETKTYPGLSEWGHVVEVKAFDKAGNSVVVSSDFTVNLSPLGGPGYLEEAAVVAVAIVAVAGVGVYFFRFRKKK